MNQLKYLAHYNQETLSAVEKLIENKKVKSYLLQKYPFSHTIKSDKELFAFILEKKNRYLKNSSPLSKALFDGKLSSLESALGLHRFVSRVQGGKLKAKNEIKIASIFRSVPLEFLEMIVVHELAHFKEKEHNKAFYNLCTHMQKSYHQVEFDLRLYLTQIELESGFEEWN
jgi:predicted metal-dependent hydrolase